MELLWLGTYASYMVYHDYFAKFRFDKTAFSPNMFDEPSGSIDANFGVDEDRKGLYLLEKVGDTAVVKVHGSLVDKFSRWHSWFPGEVTSYEAIKDALKIAQESGHSKVLMDMATPGGSVNGISTLTNLIGKLRKTGMRIDAHTDSTMHSAGYWIGAACRQITASEQAEMGSIGTMAVVRTLVDTEKQMGVKFTVLKAGKYKALGNPYEELTKEGIEYLQDNVNESNSFFLNHVSKHRGLDLSNTDQWAEGQTFYAAQGLKVGLIDKIISLDDLIGSGSTAKNPSDNRRASMKISAEKLAQIQSGADPKAVLTDAELKHYMATLADAEGDEQPGEGGESNKDDKTKTKEKPEGEGEEGDEEGGDTTADSKSIQKLYSAQLKENGRLEARLEAATDQVAKLQAQLKDQQEQTEALVVVGQAAVHKLQIALNLPQQASGTPSALLTQYNELQSKMAARFPTSQQSKDTATEDTTKDQVRALSPQALQHKVSKVTQPRR